MFPAKALTSFVLLSLLPGLALSFNDWNVPCVDGECSYDTEFASVTINGAPDFISDITKAGGWTIVDCDANAIDQAIRLVCNNEEECANLDIKAKKNQIVRLPESCGGAPFARVARAWVSEDQELPETVASKLLRRDGSAPEVMAMQLDTEWSEVDQTEYGDITFVVHGANVPGVALALADEIPARLRRSRVARGMTGLEVFRRGLFDIDFEKTADLPPISFDQSFPLFEESIQCSDATDPTISAGASIKATLNAKATADVRVGVVAEGNLLKLKVEKFGLFLGMNAEIKGELDISGNAKAKVDSGKVDLLTLPIGGFSIAGFIDVGPSFKLQGQASASLDINASAKVGLSYKVTNAEFVFPKNDKDTSGFEPGDDSLTLSVAPSSTSRAAVTAHLIPAINVGINAFGSGANIFVNLDASSTAALTLEAGAVIEEEIGGEEEEEKPEAEAEAGAGEEAGAGDAEEAGAGAAEVEESPEAPPAEEGGEEQGAEAEVEAEAEGGAKPEAEGEVEVEGESEVESDADLSVEESADAEPEVAEGDAEVEVLVDESEAPVEDEEESPVVEEPIGGSMMDDEPVEDSMMDGEALEDLMLDGDTSSEFSDMWKRQTSSSVEGCVEITSQLDVNVGADANLFGLFNEKTQFSLFSQKFELFKRCFNKGGEARKRAYPRRALAPAARSPVPQVFEKREIACLPSVPAGLLVDLINTAINAADIIAV
ncbi:hypothetical protein BDV98DRAFT_576837 [Pterulicium gracile]|uniref:DUF7223 domain-containing protein n=1 Tax=Pterulicium gracile TaxID=1884261 RepID=A0A5C3Q768_9AGAR|nr:hypothetical protein BDV98DRAFT_576837 [Pterula gracilis]